MIFEGAPLSGVPSISLVHKTIEVFRDDSFSSYAPLLIRFGDDLLQGVIETSGEPGPHVDPDHPADPDDPDLVGRGSVWEIEG